MTIAVVPVKTLADAKGRLAGALDAAGRAALVAELLRRVLEACAAAETITDVLVIAGDRRAAALAQDAEDVAVLVEPSAGLEPALRWADRTARHHPASLVVPADLPLVTAADLDAVARAHGGPVVVVAPTGDGGTGALLRRPADVVPPAFGPDSARAHLRLAARQAVRGVLLPRPGLALDIDTPEDLRAWAEVEPDAARFMPRFTRKAG